MEDIYNQNKKQTSSHDVIQDKKETTKLKPISIRINVTLEKILNNYLQSCLHAGDLSFANLPGILKHILHLMRKNNLTKINTYNAISKQEYKAMVITVNKETLDYWISLPKQLKTRLLESGIMYFIKQKKINI